MPLKLLNLTSALLGFALFLAAAFAQSPQEQCFAPGGCQVTEEHKKADAERAADTAKPGPTAKELRAELDKLQKDYDDTLKLLKEYYSKYRACDEGYTELKVLGPQRAAEKK